MRRTRRVLSIVTIVLAIGWAAAGTAKTPHPSAGCGADAAEFSQRAERR